MIEAVIFDCDGTLVDSETLSLRVLVDYIYEFGLEVSYDEAMKRFAGTNLSFVFAELADRMTRPLPDDHVAEFRRRQIDLLRRDLQPMPGADGLLSSLDLPFCVASNAPRNKIEVCLATTGLDIHFAPERIHSAYDIDRWKPEPDLFLLAAERLQFAPQNCVVVEDSLPGVEAGLAAGMTVIALDPHGGLRDKVTGATFIDGLDELPQLLV